MAAETHGVFNAPPASSEITSGAAIHRLRGAGKLGHCCRNSFGPLTDALVRHFGRISTAFAGLLFKRAELLRNRQVAGSSGLVAIGCPRIESRDRDLLDRRQDLFADLRTSPGFGFRGAGDVLTREGLRQVSRMVV